MLLFLTELMLALSVPFAVLTAIGHMLQKKAVQPFWWKPTGIKGLVIYFTFSVSDGQ